MGYDFLSITRVIHGKPPRNMPDFVQQEGRAGQECESVKTQEVAVRQSKLITNSLHSQPVTLDHDGQLTDSECCACAQLYKCYDMVFNCKIGTQVVASGLQSTWAQSLLQLTKHVFLHIYYSPNKMRLLQHKMDELEEMGVLAKPESEATKEIPILYKTTDGSNLKKIKGKDTFAGHALRAKLKRFRRLN